MHNTAPAMALRLPRLVTAALLALLVVGPASSAYASAPHYALYTNLLAHRYTAYFFPHDEFYDDGLKEAIQFVCARAPREATIISETPGVVRYYTEKFGRADLQVRTLSDPNVSPSQANAFFILQRGRTYFENEEEMKQVRAQFPLIYASCVRGHTAAEVYSRQPAGVSSACGDGQP